MVCLEVGHLSSAAAEISARRERGGGDRKAISVEDSHIQQQNGHLDKGTVVQVGEHVQGLL